jgi:hypothetical protein
LADIRKFSIDFFAWMKSILNIGTSGRTNEGQPEDYHPHSSVLGKLSVTSRPWEASIYSIHGAAQLPVFPRQQWVQNLMKHSTSGKMRANFTVIWRWIMVLGQIIPRAAAVAFLGFALIPVSTFAADPPTTPSDVPARVVTLKSPQLEVLLDQDRGLPYRYRLLANQAFIRGEDAGQDIVATVFRRQPRSFDKITLRPQAVEGTETQADFKFIAVDAGQEAVTFTLRYKLKNATVFVSLESVEEHPGFELIEVATPTLASVREEDGHAWLAHGDSGGSTVMLSSAQPGHLPENRFWGRVAATLPVVMIGTEKALCVQEVLAYMDTTELAVDGEAGHRRAALGSDKTYRVNGSLSYDMNGPAGEPRIFGNEKTPNLLVGQRPLCRLDFIAAKPGQADLNWLDGAKLAAARMPEIPTHYYDDKLMVMVMSDSPNRPQPAMTFEQTDKAIRQLAALTAYAPQVFYLWGWQFRGKDTGYPSVAEVNQRLGGYAGLMKLMADAREVNATVSLADNYDDAYKSSPAWDTNIIARRPDGELWLSRAWTGERSYIIGLAKYMAGPGPARIDYSCENYHLRDTCLIDVLSYYPIRNDWDPQHPASGVKNLLEGRYKVLEGFKRHGVDVISEQLRYAFIGRMSASDNGPMSGASPFGGDPIPLAAVIYRHSAIWGLRGFSANGTQQLDTFFWNGHGYPGLSSGSLDTTVDFYYSVLVPWFQVHYRDVESYRRDGQRTVIGLKGNSTIDLDFSANKYTITVNGVEVARDGDTFCPLGKDRIAFYSKNDRTLSAALPTGWIAGDTVARALSVDKAEEVPVSFANGKLTVSVSARHPVMLFRDQAAMRKWLREP